MCLNHITACETYHFFHALTLKLAPSYFTKQCKTSRTQEFECEYNKFSITQLTSNSSDYLTSCEFLFIALVKYLNYNQFDDVYAINYLNFTLITLLEIVYNLDMEQDIY